MRGLVGKIGEGDRIHVEYTSVYSDSDQSCTGDVLRKREMHGGRVVYVEFVTDSKGERRELYKDEVADRRLYISPELDAVHLETRNGYRWQTLSRGKATVSVPNDEGGR